MPFLRTLLTYGLLLGLLLGLYTTLMWLTRLDTTYLATGQYLDLAVVLLPVGCIAAATHQQRRQGHLSGVRRVALGVASCSTGPIYSCTIPPSIPPGLLPCWP